MPAERSGRDLRCLFAELIEHAVWRDADRVCSVVIDATADKSVWARELIATGHQTNVLAYISKVDAGLSILATNTLVILIAHGCVIESVTPVANLAI